MPQLQSTLVAYDTDLRTEKKFGQIDVLVNNAGTNYRRPFHLMKFEDFWKVIEVNFKAVMIHSWRALMEANVLDA
jgi:NADP-dependent 3-hydroxy acid dehydrogenase YdfG